jgi:hypothetical protein
LRTVVAWLLAAPAAALAHHSGLYDAQDVVAIEGTITSIDWVNPHVRLILESIADDGGAQRWVVEGTSVNALARWGIERDLLQIGDRLGVRGLRSRFERSALLGATVQLADGRQLLLSPDVAAELGLADTGSVGLFPPPPADGAAAGQAQGIFGVWTPRARPPAVDFELTPRAREAALAYRPLADDPALRCIAPGMPSMLATPYPIEFIDQGEQITIRFEEWDGRRTVYMNPRSGPRIQEPSPYGVSFGRWEGETLAIFTTYIRYPYFDALGTPQSAAVTVLERYTPSSDYARLEWTITVTDPATFVRPVVRRGFMAFEPGEEIKPYDCTLPVPPSAAAD